MVSVCSSIWVVFFVFLIPISNGLFLRTPRKESEVSRTVELHCVFIGYTVNYYPLDESDTLSTTKGFKQLHFNSNNLYFSWHWGENFQKTQKELLTFSPQYYKTLLNLTSHFPCATQSTLYNCWLKYCIAPRKAFVIYNLMNNVELILRFTITWQDSCEDTEVFVPLFVHLPYANTVTIV